MKILATFSDNFSFPVCVKKLNKMPSIRTRIGETQRWARVLHCVKPKLPYAFAEVTTDNFNPLHQIISTGSKRFWKLWRCLPIGHDATLKPDDIYVIQEPYSQWLSVTRESKLGHYAHRPRLTEVVRISYYRLSDIRCWTVCHNGDGGSESGSGGGRHRRWHGEREAHAYTYSLKIVHGC